MASCALMGKSKRSDVEFRQWTGETQTFYMRLGRQATSWKQSVLGIGYRAAQRVLHEPAHQKQDEAAQRVVSWIRVIVSAVGASDSASRGSHTTEEMAKIYNGLLLTSRVGINSVSHRNIPEQVIRATRRSSLIIFEQWKVALDTTSWEALDEHAREVTGSFSALRLTPLDLASASPIAAFFGERTD